MVLLRQDSTGELGKNVTNITTLPQLFNHYTLRQYILYYKISEMLCLNMEMRLYLIKNALICIHYQNRTVNTG